MSIPAFVPAPDAPARTVLGEAPEPEPAPDEALVAGRLAEVIDQISSVRADIRAARGWVMDTYLLRP